MHSCQELFVPKAGHALLVWCDPTVAQLEPAMPLCAPALSPPFYPEHGNRTAMECTVGQAQASANNSVSSSPWIKMPEC
jgi:hypothetical protein